MPKKTNLSIIIRPVAWNQTTGRVLKHQASAQLGNCRITSNPRPTPEAAFANLLKLAEGYLKLINALSRYSVDKQGFADITAQMAQPDKAR